MNEPPEWEKPVDPYTTPHHGGNDGVSGRGGSCLRTFFFWGLPAIVVPLIIGLFVAVWPVGLALALAFLFWMGRMQWRSSAGGPEAGDAPQWSKVFLYVVVQVVLIPLLWFALVWGFCNVTGSGKF